MSVSPKDDALDRLNYFNGQRLAAGDFRTEQHYHVGMRRLLNRSLYSPGIVAGLEVLPDDQNSHHVIVSQGLAFDCQGREIFLSHDVSVQAMGAPSSGKGVVFGNLLVVSYREVRHNLAQGVCSPLNQSTSNYDKFPWGAPTRVAAQPVFEFVDSWPSADSGKVVLAQIELSKECKVVRVLTGVRQYAMPTKPQTVQPISIEGEKDIDVANRKDLYFHIVGGPAASITLYLRGGRFSTLYYTETGRHAHHLNLDTKEATHNFSHAHSAYSDTNHPPNYYGPDFVVVDRPKSGSGIPDSGSIERINGEHADHLIYKFASIRVSTELGMWSHRHSIQDKTDDAGAFLDSRDAKPALTTFKDLAIYLDGDPVTAQICDQLEARLNQWGQWRVEKKPGDIRMSGKKLSGPDGTGAIDLLRLGVEIGPGEHVLSFRVLEPDQGGQLHYNLYVA